MSILEMITKIPGRKYNEDTFIAALGKIEVKLDDEDEEARAKQQMEQARTEDEGAMVAIIDKLFKNANRSGDDG